ncbi:zinc ABC transporter substrate-binding protein [Paenibacillus yonginensis]|uniref:Zinc ABC transporter substrate-binding protein n=1 Tax=Paenibacillus yonginensis TaxID=1462996 RepID=A0A1B1MZ37_9BACL|nr:metal ABC transporter substrate-binding protein [Paenibacillus yonginensis]ANS74433.1 zinc ABC transporter substrate-binding protein [Paenibacillus yonginensis]
MKRRKQLLVILSLSLVLVAAGCGSKQTGGQSQAGDAVSASNSSAVSTAGVKLKIETSFYPMYEFTRHVAGDLAEVHNLVPAGAEPHDWEPTPKDIAEITDADVLVYNGAGMEGWIDQVTSSATGGHLNLIEASKGLDIMDGFVEEEEGESGEEEAGQDQDHSGLDPHVWLSPALAIKEVQNIEQGLSQADPADADTFKANADAYIAELQTLDQQFKDSLKDPKRTDFITQHAAFGYLAREYGLTQVPIAGLSPDQEPSAAKMAEIVQFAKEHQVKTIFFETLVSSNVAETIAKEIGAKSDVLNPLEGLTDEELAQNQNYISVMKQNLTALQKALNE